MKVILNQYDAKDILRFIRQSTNLTQKEYGDKLKKVKIVLKVMN